MRQMTRVELVWTVLALMSVACGSSGSASAPSPGSAAISVSASPGTIAGAACAGCGAQSTDREAVTQLTIQETGGVAGSVSGIDMTLRETGTNAVIASGSFDSAAVGALAGSSRVAANGSLTVRSVGVHYAREQSGKAATLTFTVRFRDDLGNNVSRDLAVPVSVT